MLYVIVTVGPECVYSERNQIWIIDQQHSVHSTRLILLSLSLSRHQHTPLSVSLDSTSTMSRSQGHRKSQSTSALAVIAAGGPIPSGISSSRGTGSSSSKMSQSTSTSTSTSAATPRASRRHQSQHSQSRLGAVIEDDRYEHTEAGNQSPGIPGIDSDLAKLQRAMDERKASDGATAGERSRSRPPSGIDEVKAALNDVSTDSLRFYRHQLIDRYARSDLRNVDVSLHYARSNVNWYKHVPNNHTQTSPSRISSS